MHLHSAIKARVVQPSATDERLACDYIFAQNRQTKNNIMKARLILSWRTSILGVLLLVVSVALLFLNHISFSEFTAFLPTILGLLYVKDSSLMKNRD